MISRNDHSVSCGAFFLSQNNSCQNNWSWILGHCCHFWVVILVWKTTFYYSEIITLFVVDKILLYSAYRSAFADCMLPLCSIVFVVEILPVSSWAVLWTLTSKLSGCICGQKTTISCFLDSLPLLNRRTDTPSSSNGCLTAAHVLPKKRSFTQSPLWCWQSGKLSQYSGKKSAKRWTDCE